MSFLATDTEVPLRKMAEEEDDRVWWNPEQPDQAVSWRSEVHLSPGFFKADYGDRKDFKRRF